MVFYRIVHSTIFTSCVSQVIPFTPTDPLPTIIGRQESPGFTRPVRRAESVVSMHVRLVVSHLFQMGEMAGDLYLTYMIVYDPTGRHYVDDPAEKWQYR